jgi:hypothetical protein
MPMSGVRPILLQAVVSAAEQGAVRDAAEHLSASLSKAAGVPCRVDCAFPPDLDSVDRSAAPAVLVTSLLAEVDRVDEPWAATEQRLLSTYRALTEDGRLTVLVSTVLRHVSRDGVARDGAADTPPGPIVARRVRIRRLNLLAAALSHETGCFVIDIDRALADIGAQALRTDYRLAGPFAAGAAAKAVAMTLLSAGLDDVVPVEVQEEARKLIAAFQPPRASTASVKMQPLGVYGVAERSGRRTQIVVPVRHTVDESQVDLQIRRLMSGQIGLGAASAMLMRSMAHHGFRSATRRLIGGIARYLKVRVLVWRPGRG